MNVSYNFDIFDDSKHPTFRQKAGLEPMNYDHSKNNTTKTDTVSNENQTTKPSPTSDKGEEEWSFFDFLDIINPLQHIPIVNSIYREMTGDEIKAPARILGGTLFGGFSGAATSIVNAIIEDASGKDIGEHMIAMAFGDDKTEQDIEKSPTETIVLAQAEPKEKTTKTSTDEIKPSTTVQNDPTIEIFARQFIDHEGNIIRSAPTNKEESPPKTTPTYQPISNVMLNNQQMPHLMIEALDKYQQMQTISQSQEIAHGSLF